MYTTVTIQFHANIPCPEFRVIFLHKFDQQERENQVFLCNKENTIAIYITTALKYYRSIHNYIVSVSALPTCSKSRTLLAP